MSKEFTVLSKLSLDSDFKFLELTSDLLSILEKNKDSLVLKAPNDEADIVLCSGDKTFQIRQRNHSNTVLVVRESLQDDSVYGYSTMSSVFESRQVTGSIDTSGIPIYDGSIDLKDDPSAITIDQLKESSAISDGEFEKLWFNLNGSSSNDIAILLSDDFITKALHALIMSITASELNFDELSLITVYNSIKEEAPELTIDIVETIIRKFASSDAEPFRLDKTKIAQWYGVHSLKKHASLKPLPLSDFVIQWKSEIPPFFECPIELSQLNGYYVCPFPDKVQYISKQTLPLDINSRFKSLFKIRSTWELDELIPFIEEFNVKNIKYESFILKYARKKKFGKKTFIVPR